jgi:hypothetical protein
VENAREKYICRGVRAAFAREPRAPAELARAPAELARPPGRAMICVLARARENCALAVHAKAGALALSPALLPRLARTS